jgi:hypothetical protein
MTRSDPVSGTVFHDSVPALTDRVRSIKEKVRNTIVVYLLLLLLRLAFGN